MFPPQCPFCDHVNPAGAKFCNDCGSPLHLKPCKQCQAINDQAAKICYMCGMQDPALVTTLDTLLVSLAAENIATPTTPNDVGFERARPTLPESTTKSPDAFSRQQDNAAVTDCETGVEVATPPGEGVSSPISETLRASPVVPASNFGSKPERRPMSRVALAGILPVALLIAAALSALYVYRFPPQLIERVSATFAPADEPSATPQSVPGTVSEPASSAAPAKLDTARVAAISIQGPAPPNESRTGVSPPPDRHAGTPTNRDGADSRSVAAMEPQPPRVAVDQADQAIAAQLATQTEMILVTPGTSTSIAAEPRDNTTPAAANQLAPTHAAATPAGDVRPPPRDSRAISQSHATRPSGCTEAMAALGHCSSKKTSTIAKTTAKNRKKTSTKKPVPAQATPAPKALATTIETQKTAP